MLRRTLVVGSVAIAGSCLLPGGASAQRFGGQRFRNRFRRPSLPAPFNNLNAAQSQAMSGLAQHSVAWLLETPPPEDGDPTIDLFGPFAGRRAEDEEGEELPENEYGLIVLSDLTPAQRRTLLELTKRQQIALAKYHVRRKRLLAILRTLKGVTKPDREIDRQVRELGQALGEAEAKMAFEQATVFTELAATLTDEQKIFLNRLRTEPRVFNTDSKNVTTIREGLAALEEPLQLALQDIAAKAGSFLTASAAVNARNAPARANLLGEIERPTPDHVANFLRNVNAEQFAEYLRLLAADASLSQELSVKRAALLAALDVKKRIPSTTDAKAVALGGQCGVLEARRALQRVRSFEKIRTGLNEGQRFVLEQAVE